MISRSRVAGRPKKGPIALSKVKTKTLYIGCPGSSFPSPAIAKNKNPNGVPIKREPSTAGNMANPVFDMFASNQGTSHASLYWLQLVSLVSQIWGWEQKKRKVIPVLLLRWVLWCNQMLNSPCWPKVKVNQLTTCSCLNQNISKWQTAWWVLKVSCDMLIFYQDYSCTNFWPQVWYLPHVANTTWSVAIHLTLLATNAIFFCYSLFQHPRPPSCQVSRQTSEVYNE